MPAKERLSLSEKEILAAAMELPPSARAHVAEQLLVSLASEEERAIERAWIEEAERRLEAYRAGRMKTIPGEEVFEALRSRRQ